MPTLVVLTADRNRPDDRPSGITDIDPQLRIRFTDRADLRSALADADALLVWDFFSDAVREAWPATGRLSWIHVAAAGVDKLLFPALVDSPVVVTNARGIFDRPIAEYVLACVLAHAKDLAGSYRLQQVHDWRHRETRSIAGGLVMVVGTGSIGRQIGRTLRAVGMSVTGAGRQARPVDPDFDRVVSSADLAAHLADVDYLVVATPLTPQTRDIIDDVVLAAVPPHCYLVNVARGACVNDAALLDALRDGRLAGAALDVFAQEPLPSNDPFWSEPRVLVSPHMSGDEVGWRDALAQQFAGNARRWLDGRPLVNLIDKRSGFAA